MFGSMLLAAGSAFAAEDLLYETPYEEFGTPQTRSQPSARGNLGTIRLDNWGYFQENVNGTDQWQYRPRLFMPWVFGNEWIATLRADVPMLYTNNTGPANREGGYWAASAISSSSRSWTPRRFCRTSRCAPACGSS